MASYARTAPSAENHQLSVLAQAKPAIISVSSILSEKINSTLRFSSKTLQRQESARDGSHAKAHLAFEQPQKFIGRHIEDDNVIQKQNSSNQMRQAAVMAALASQQKVRLSATERLALTARKPSQLPANQPASLDAQAPSSHPNLYHPPPQLPPPPPQSTMNHTAQPAPNAKAKQFVPMPTLETLLAVQRQLHQHTRKHLTGAQQVITSNNENGLQKQQESLNCNDITSSSSATNLKLATSNLLGSQSRNKPLPPSPPKSPSNAADCAHHQKLNQPLDFAYDKDLPPLPASISPSTTATDDSQMNSLDSQSSPANSLVSIPPPPPPILSYLEQYDEVDSSCRRPTSSSSSSTTTASTIHQYSSSSNASTPSTTISSSSAMLSSVKQFFPPPIAPVEPFSAQKQSADSFPPPPTSYNIPNPPLPVHCYEQATQRRQPPSLAPKPHLFQQTIDHHHQKQQQQSSHLYLPANQHHNVNKYNFSQKENIIKQTLISNQAKQAAQMPQPSPQFKQAPSNIAPTVQANNLQFAYNNNKPQINYQAHLFMPASCGSPPNPLPPPPPPPPLQTNDSDGGFDEFDSGSFRFPTPPLPDRLLGNVDDEGDEEEDELDDDDDDDFQCKIPTPPPHKSMSTASFLDLHQQQLAASNQSAAPIFNSSTFSVPSVDGDSSGTVQPPPLFRQQQQATVAKQTAATNSPQAAQLTVHISNEVGSGLLSTATADLNHQNLKHHLHGGANQHNHHHHIMMGMTASSSSPSSSSDGDGHSSNASSSTSGIHSSIDSSSSSSTISKLDDFNYSAVKLLRKQQQELTTALPLETNRELATAKSASLQQTQQQEKQLKLAQSKPSSASSLSVSSVTSISSGSSNIIATATSKSSNHLRRPALKQKKSVSFSDKVELVACAEEQSEDHLPNPLLARVLAGKLQ